MIATAALCPSAPLLAPGLSGAQPALPELREATAQAVARLLDPAPDLVAVVGPAAETATWPAGTAVDFGPFRGQATTGPALPLSLALGATFLKNAGYTGALLFQGVAPDATRQTCAELGTALGEAAGTVALLVVADGTTRRSLKAPGWFDERAAGFDADVERAVRDGDLPALLGLDTDLAAELQATGRSSWQVLAAAVGEKACRARVDYADAPLGVGYLVAGIRVDT